MLQFLKTHKKPLSLIIKETYFALNIFFIITIIFSTILYFYLLNNSNNINYKRVKLTLNQNKLISEHQMLKTQILNTSSFSNISQDIFHTLNMQKPKQVIYIKPRNISLEK